MTWLLIWLLWSGGEPRARIRALYAEVASLKAGGCARNQGTTQYCQEAVDLQAEVASLRAERETWCKKTFDLMSANEHLRNLAEDAKADLGREARAALAGKP